MNFSQSEWRHVLKSSFHLSPQTPSGPAVALKLRSCFVFTMYRSLLAVFPNPVGMWSVLKEWCASFSLLLPLKKRKKKKKVCNAAPAGKNECNCFARHKNLHASDTFACTRTCSVYKVEIWSNQDLMFQRHIWKKKELWQIASICICYFLRIVLRLCEKGHWETTV